MLRRLFGIALLVAGCGQVATTTPSDGVPTTTPSGSTAASAAALPTGWVVFTAPDGSFSVGLPGQPNGTSETVPSQAGALDFHSFEAKSADKATTYGVSYTDFPAGWQVDDGDRALDDTVTSGAAASNATLPQSHIINLGPVPGRDWTATAVSDGRMAHGRVYAIGSRMYQVIVVGGQAHAEEFLDSFAIR